MNLLIRSAQLVEQSEDGKALKLSSSSQDLLIQDGIISRIADSIEAPKGAEIVENVSVVSPGWFDTFARFCDPGDEYREDLRTGAAAAAAGGFTGVAILPDTNPALDTKADMEYVLGRSRTMSVEVLPMACVSQGGKGEQLAELIDLNNAGAVAFCEGDHPIAHPGLLMRALRYVRPFNGLIINLPQEPSLVGKGEVHEGLVSTRMGFPGTPVLAETLMIQRDIGILRYVGGRLHFPTVSSREGVELIRCAKAEGLAITCGVAAYQLMLDESHTATYDSNFKVRPPLRSADDRESLVEGLLDGTIDLVCSAHIPQHEDCKKLEFEYANPGINGLETTFSNLWMAIKDRGADLADVSRWLSHNPRKLFGQEIPQIKEGQKANLTLLDEQASWIPESLKSRSSNNPFLGKELQGCVRGMIRDDQFELNEPLAV